MPGLYIENLALTANFFMLIAGVVTFWVTAGLSSDFMLGIYSWCSITFIGAIIMLWLGSSARQNYSTFYSRLTPAEVEEVLTHSGAIWLAVVAIVTITIYCLIAKFSEETPAVQQSRANRAPRG